MERKYIPHIDGLRTIAVISVFLFHLNIQGIVGGYLGVDVFFVISGYLITKILKDGAALGELLIFRILCSASQTAVSRPDSHDSPMPADGCRRA